MSRLSVIVVIIGITAMCVHAEELYSDRYDDINILDIVNNDKLRTQYNKCFLELGPCITGDSKFFREIFGEALQTKCRRCTEKQKVILDTIVDWYTTNQPGEWRAIIEKSIDDIRKKHA